MSYRYQYETYGPFDLEVEDNNKISLETLKEFFVDVGSSCEGLSDAIGIYVLSVQKRSEVSLKPWYVGLTNRQGFRTRFGQQRSKFREILDVAGQGKPKVFLIALKTPTGAFRKATNRKKLSFNSELEKLLIGSCLAQNAELFNAKEIKHLREISVPGYHNEKPGKPKTSARALKRMLNAK